MIKLQELQDLKRKKVRPIFLNSWLRKGLNCIWHQLMFCCPRERIFHHMISIFQAAEQAQRCVRRVEKKVI